MKCSCCGTELLGGMDTFGSAQEPLCWTCFINDVPNIRSLETELDDIDDEIDDIKCEIESHEIEIINLRVGLMQLNGKRINLMNKLKSKVLE